MQEEIKKGYKKTEIGVIPEEWEVKRLGEIFNFSSGMSISRAELSERGICYLHYGDIHKRNKNYIDTDKDYEEISKIDLDFFKIKQDALLNTGDVVFVDASEDYEGIGKSVVVVNNNKEIFISGLHTIVAKDIDNQLNILYKKYCFSTEEVKRQFRMLATGATVLGISKTNIKKIKILVPPLKEQQKIGFILSTVDEHIEQTDKLIEKTKELKKGLMQKLLTKGIGHTEFKKTEIGEIPKDWEVKKIKDVIEVNPRKNKVEDENIEISFITMADISDDGIILNKNIKKYKEVNKGYTPFINDDVLLAKITPCFENGKKALVKDLVNGIGFGSTEFHVLRGNNSVLPEYIYYYISTHHFRERAKLNMTGSAGQRRVPANFIKNYIIPLPPLQEQQKIASILSEVDNQIEQYQLKKEKLETLKKGLMQQLLTGKKRVKV